MFVDSCMSQLFFSGLIGLEGSSSDGTKWEDCGDIMQLVTHEECGSEMSQQPNILAGV